MKTNFRVIPDKAFGFKPIVRIRDIDAVVHNYLLFKERADKSGCYDIMVALGSDNKKVNDYTLKEYKQLFIY